MKNPPEGTWFGVPIVANQLSVGIVARVSRANGILLLYLFREMWPELPPLSVVRELRPEQALFVLRAGGMGLRKREWPIIGRDPDWRREEWRVPEYVRVDPLARRSYAVQYSDDDPSIVESEHPIEYVTSRPRTMVAGHGYVEGLLRKALLEGQIGFY